MKKRTLAFILAAFMALTAIVDVSMGAESSGEWFYEVNDDGDTATITGYSGSKNVIIPSELDGYSVRIIGSRAFAQSKITSVVIPDGVRTIESEAFYSCSSLTSITIPDSVKSIGFFAFRTCPSLETVYYGGSESQWKEIDIINTSNGNVDLNHSEIIYAKDDSDVPPPTEEEVGEWEYRMNDAGSGALITRYTGSETEVTIPSTIGGYKVLGLSCWGEINEQSGMSTTHGVFYETPVTSVVIPDSVTTIGNNTFSGCASLTGVTIPDSVTTIGDSAFYGCRSLTNITIPNSVKEIGVEAFGSCTSLTSITIPDSVTTLDDFTFYYCVSLTSVKIGKSVKKKIDKDQFYNCTALTSVDFDKENETYKSIDGVVYTKDGTTLVYWPLAKKNVVIPNGVTTIGMSVFNDCPQSCVLIPDSVTMIDKWAFGKAIKTVCYGGSKEQWDKITIELGNYPLLDANIVFDHPAHDYAAVVTAPSCTAAGFTTYTCSLCGDSYTADEVPALGHDYVDRVCTRCGERDGTPGDADGNGFVNARDVILVMRASLPGFVAPDGYNKNAADLEKDGEINARDVIAVMKAALKQL